jgi:glycosyltransferase involved in cell wall biosynthesis
MNNKITLSICIATLNRGAFIGATLDSIISQANEQVEIVIVDGASTDNTEEIVRLYKKNFPQIRYVRLSVKGGVDQDYCRAVELAVGEYCWLFTDDDILKPGAIQSVMAAMQHDYGLILVNAEVRNASLSRILEDRLLHFKNNMIYQTQDFERFFFDVADYLSFIGCVVIKRSLWNDREKERYYGTAFVHVGVIFQQRFTDNIMVLVEPLISIRYGNALWTSNSFEISLFQWPNLIWSFPLFSDSAKRQVCKREPWRGVKALLMYRARGVFSLKEYRMLLEPHLHSHMERFFIHAIAIFPGFLLNLGLIIYFSVFRNFFPRSSMHAVDLKNSRFYYKNYMNYKSGKKEAICI